MNYDDMYYEVSVCRQNKDAHDAQVPQCLHFSNRFFREIDVNIKEHCHFLLSLHFHFNDIVFQRG
jgi:hypothetical protein